MDRQAGITGAPSFYIANPRLDIARLPKENVRGNDADQSGYFKGGMAKPDLSKQLNTLRELIAVDGRTLTQGALCWLLAKSPNVLPIPSAKTATQAVENARAMEFGPLPDGVMAEVEAVLERLDEEIKGR